MTAFIRRPCRTLRSSGSGVWCSIRAGSSTFLIRAGYALDECHVDKSGRNGCWFSKRQADGKLDNRVVDVSTGMETALTDAAGALGHLDTGFGYAIGADNYNPLPNASILLKFPVTSTERPLGPVVHFNKRWDIAAANHIAHGNAIAGQAAGRAICVREQREPRGGHG